MPRNPRPQFDGACYHVMNRGKNRQVIFRNHYDYRLFLRLIGKAHELHGLKLHAFCLMPNHFHLMATTPEGNIAKCMEYVTGVYARKFNYFGGADGAVFKSRYTSKLVDDDAYAIYLTRYIHRNPVDGIRPLVDSPVEYEWSSMRWYVDSHNEPPWLDCELVNSIMSNNTTDRTAYLSYVLQPDPGVPDGARYLATIDLDAPTRCAALVEYCGKLVGLELLQTSLNRNSNKRMKVIQALAYAHCLKISPYHADRLFEVQNRQSRSRHLKFLHRNMTVEVAAIDSELGKTFGK